MTVDYPKPAHIPGLRALWKEAFGDTDDFLDAFFDIGFSPRRCRCIANDDTVAAALYWFEVTCEGRRLAYLYAVATAASQRGRGLFTALLADTKKLLSEDGFDGILLVPETEALGRMYEKFGFCACTKSQRLTAAAGDTSIEVREIDAAEFTRLRRKLLPEGSVLQEGEMLDFLAAFCRFWAGEGWLAAGQVYDGKLACAELLGNANAAQGLLRALDVPSGTFRMPGGEEPFAWLLPLHGGCVRPSYFAFALD